MSAGYLLCKITKTAFYVSLNVQKCIRFSKIQLLDLHQHLEYCTILSSESAGTPAKAQQNSHPANASPDRSRGSAFVEIIDVPG